MTEEEAREILRRGDRDGFEAWIAGQAWIAVQGGWLVASTRDGWSIDLAPVSEGVRVRAFSPGPQPQPAVWVVAAGRQAGAEGPGGEPPGPARRHGLPEA